MTASTRIQSVALGRHWLPTLVGLLLLSVPTLAQPTVLWQRFAGYSSPAEFSVSTIRLSETQFVSAGVWYSGVPGATHYPLLTFTRPTGDTIRLLRITVLPDVNFVSVAAADSGDFYALGSTLHDSTNTGSDLFSLLCRFDSLGNLRWRRYYQSSAASSGIRVVALPDGALLASAASGAAEVRRVDGRGRTRWVRQYGRNTDARDLIALADGSYALLTADPNRFPPPHIVYDYDGWVIKLTAQGDTVASAYVGDSAVY